MIGFSPLMIVSITIARVCFSVFIYSFLNSIVSPSINFWRSRTWYCKGPIFFLDLSVIILWYLDLKYVRIFLDLKSMIFSSFWFSFIGAIIFSISFTNSRSSGQKNMSWWFNGGPGMLWCFSSIGSSQYNREVLMPFLKTCEKFRLLLARNYMLST